MVPPEKKKNPGAPVGAHRDFGGLDRDLVVEVVAQRQRLPVSAGPLHNDHLRGEDLSVPPVLVAVGLKLHDREARNLFGLHPAAIRAREAVQARQAPLAAGGETVGFAAGIEAGNRHRHLKLPGVAALAVVIDFPELLIVIAKLIAPGWNETVGDTADAAIDGPAVLPLLPSERDLVGVRDAARALGNAVAVADGELALLAELQQRRTKKLIQLGADLDPWIVAIGGRQRGLVDRGELRRRCLALAL